MGVKLYFNDRNGAHYHAISIQIRESDHSELSASRMTLLTETVLLFGSFCPASGSLEAAPVGPSSSLRHIQKIWGNHQRSSHLCIFNQTHKDGRRALVDMLDLSYRLTNPETKALVELAELITPCCLYTDKTMKPVRIFSSFCLLCCLPLDLAI